jgi:hypothetical protein
VDPSDIVGHLVRDFTIDAATAEAEVDRVLGELRERGLVTP